MKYMKRLFSKAKKFGVIVGAVALGATSASAAVDLTAVETAMTAGSGQIEGFAPTVIGFVLVLVVIGAFIKLIKRAA
jgi:hypothetical protein